MNTWFEVSIRYQKTAENGMEKKVTEKYLFDSLSFTESEGRCIEEMTPFISGEFTVSDIKRANSSQTKNRLTGISNASYTLSHWMKKLARKRKLPPTFLFKRQICAMRLRSWMKA